MQETLVLTTLPEPGECEAHLAANAFTSMFGLPASSVPAAGETIQFPAGAAADKKRFPREEALASRQGAARASMRRYVCKENPLPPLKRNEENET